MHELPTKKAGATTYDFCNLQSKHVQSDNFVPLAHALRLPFHVFFSLRMNE